MSALNKRELAGFLNVNKPLNSTSHDVVAQVRRRYRVLTGARKVGHAGTLDPMASGVLVLCLGKATRLSEYVMRGEKTYQARVRLGIVTTSFDADGEIVSVSCADGISLTAVEDSLKSFVGEIQQVPPMYSAIKVGGRKLYKLARKGQTIKREPRTVQIDSVNIMCWENPSLELTIRCSAGTYIRSLAHDLGQRLGIGAHLSALRRTASGRFTLENSVELDRVLTDDAWQDQIVSPYEAMIDHPRAILSEAEIARISHGRTIDRRSDLCGENIFAFNDRRDLVAVLESDTGSWKPRKVFVAPP